MSDDPGGPFDAAADEPVEFRGRRAGRSTADWLAERNARESLVYAGFAAVTAACAAAATLVTWLAAFGFLYLWIGYGGLGTFLAAVFAAAAVAGLFLLNRKLTPDLADRLTVDTARGPVRLRVARLTGASWMQLFEFDADQHPAVRVVLNLLLLAPRLVLLTRLTWGLSGRLKRVDLAATGRAVDLLMAADGRVPLPELIDEFPLADPQRLIDDLTGVDGVVFLIRDTPGLTATPSLIEDYEEWRKQARKRRDG